MNLLAACCREVHFVSRIKVTGNEINLGRGMAEDQKMAYQLNIKSIQGVNLGHELS